MATRLIPTCVVAAAAVVSMAPQAGADVPRLAGTTVVSTGGTAAGWVRLDTPVSAKPPPDGSPPPMAVALDRTGGTFVAMELRSPEAGITGPQPMVYAARVGDETLQGATMDPLPAGDYRLYLFSDARRAQAVIALRGTGGSLALGTTGFQALPLDQLAAPSHPSRVPATFAVGGYASLAEHSFLYTSLHLRPAGARVGRGEVCMTGDGGGRDPGAFDVGCPGATSIAEYPRDDPRFPAAECCGEGFLFDEPAHVIGIGGNFTLDTADGDAEVHLASAPLDDGARPPDGEQPLDSPPPPADPVRPATLTPTGWLTVGARRVSRRTVVATLRCADERACRASLLMAPNCRPSLRADTPRTVTVPRSGRRRLLLRSRGRHAQARLQVVGWDSARQQRFVCVRVRR